MKNDPNPRYQRLEINQSMDMPNAATLTKVLQVIDTISETVKENFDAGISDNTA